MDRTKVRAIAPDVGGGFGAKLAIYPEYLLVAVAATPRQAGALVRVALGVDGEHDARPGQVQRSRSAPRARAGSSASTSRCSPTWARIRRRRFLPTITQEMMCGVYDIPRVRCRGASVVTNATPIAPYRGAGRPEAAALIERAIDMLADELGMDPAEVRRTQPDPARGLPVHDGGRHDVRRRRLRAALDEALRLAGYDELRAEQATRRERGDHLLLGIGVSTYVEITAFARRSSARSRSAPTAPAPCSPASPRTARATRPPRSDRERRPAVPFEASA